MNPKKEIKEGTPESKQIASFDDLKEVIEADITERIDEIQYHEEQVDRKYKEIDMLDYLIAKLNERIEEKEKEE
jgi:Na+/phosphate symporter